MHSSPPPRLKLKWYIPPPLCPPLPAASSITALPIVLTFSLRTILQPVSVSLKAQLSVFCTVSTRFAGGHRRIKKGQNKPSKAPERQKKNPHINHPYGVEGKEQCETRYQNGEERSGTPSKTESC